VYNRCERLTNIVANSPGDRMECNRRFNSPPYTRISWGRLLFRMSIFFSRLYVDWMVCRHCSFRSYRFLLPHLVWSGSPDWYLKVSEWILQLCSEVNLLPAMMITLTIYRSFYFGAFSPPWVSVSFGYSTDLDAELSFDHRLKVMARDSVIYFVSITGILAFNTFYTLYGRKLIAPSLIL